MDKEEILNSREVRFSTVGFNDLGDLGSRKSRAASVPWVPAPKELTISPSTKLEALQSF